MGDLHVELYGEHVGTLRGTWRDFDFVPAQEAVATFGLDSQVLSAAIPLTAVPTRAHRDRRRNFFRELLPEGRMLEHLASNAGVPAHDVIGVLRRYGRDVAGALQIWDPDVPGEPRSPAIETVDDAGVATMLRDVAASPLGNATAGGKSSLPGVQDKIVLVQTENGWARAIDGYPSTHIIKPASHEQKSLIYDEEYGSRLARALGLMDYSTWLTEFDGVSALAIERYDRASDAPSGRLHQEDFNQALGAEGNQKYQRYGGRVSLVRIAELLARLTDDDARQTLLSMVVLSVAVGNLDMHAKNLSLLHAPDGTMTPAPAYDVVPQVHHPNDGEVALAVDGVYRHADITAENLVAEGERWGISGADSIVNAALQVVQSFAESEQPDPRAYPPLAEDIVRFCGNLLAGRPAGAR